MSIFLMEIIEALSNFKDDNPEIIKLLIDIITKLLQIIDVVMTYLLSLIK